MTAETLAAGIAIAFLAAVCQSVTGFGFALVMTPLLALAWEVKPAVATSILLGTVVLFPLLGEVRGHVSLPRVSTLFAGFVVGVPPGVFLLERLDADTLRLVVAGAAILGGLLLYFSPALASGDDSLLLRLTAGAISGAIGSSTSMGGPPIVLYLLGREREIERFRATLVAFFLPASGLTLVAFAIVGQITGDVLLLSAAALPAMAVGLGAGAWLRRHLDAQRFRAVVVGVLIATSLTVVLSATGVVG